MKVQKKRKKLEIPTFILGIIGIFIISFIGIYIFDSIYINTTEKSSESESVIVNEAMSTRILDKTPIPTRPTPTPMTVSAQSSVEDEQEYKDACLEYKYKDVLQNPEEYIGKHIKVTVKISSVNEESWLSDCKSYLAYSNDEYNWWAGDLYVIMDRREEQKPKLLEEEIIVVYGEIAEPDHTSTLIISSSDVFTINMKYVDFVSE